MDGAGERKGFLDGAGEREGSLDGAGEREGSLDGAGEREGSLDGAGEREGSLDGAGEREGSLDGAGEREGSLDGAGEREASLGVRLAWVYMRGVFPRNEVPAAAEPWNREISPFGIRREASHRGMLSQEAWRAWRRRSSGRVDPRPLSHGATRYSPGCLKFLLGQTWSRVERKKMSSSDPRNCVASWADEQHRRREVELSRLICFYSLKSVAAAGSLMSSEIAPSSAPHVLVGYLLLAQCPPPSIQQ